MKVLVTGHQGYIGSALVPHLVIQGHVVHGIGRSQDYRYLFVQDVQDYDVIVHLAAHSSVPKCVADPSGAISNNVAGFASILNQLNPKQRVVYATTGSILHGVAGDGKESDPITCKAMLYDVTKYAMEGVAATHSHKNTVGLRFGVVCGLSPHMRWELMINSMARSAHQKGEVIITNEECRRSVLGLQDLLRAVTAAIEVPAITGVINLSSFSSTIGEIGRQVAGYFNVPVVNRGNTAHCYDFSLNTTKAREQLDFIPRESCQSICDSLRGVP